jgi:hypothetical protein
MSALTLVMTTAGLGRFTAAQAQDDIDLTIAQVGFTASVFVPAPTLTALPGEHRRIGAISGQAIGDNIVHMIIRDDAAIGYQVRGFGLFLSDGTLFAVYGQPNMIVEKTAMTTLLMPLDIAFPTAAIDKLVFGDTNFLNPPATSVTRGIVELATLDEGEGGDPQRVTTGAVVKAMIASALAMVSQALEGLTRRTIYGAGLVDGGGDLTSSRTLTVTAASSAQVREGTAANVAVTPASLAAGQVMSGEAGEYVFPGGFRVKWGYVAGAITSERQIPLLFPAAFPTACCWVEADSINASGSPSGDTQLQEMAGTKTAAGITLFSQSDGATISDAGGGFRWRAWGF